MDNAVEIHKNAVKEALAAQMDFNAPSRSILGDFFTIHIGAKNLRDSWEILHTHSEWTSHGRWSREQHTHYHLVEQLPSARLKQWQTWGLPEETTHSQIYADLGINKKTAERLGVALLGTPHCPFNFTFIKKTVEEFKKMPEIIQNSLVYRLENNTDENRNRLVELAKLVWIFANTDYGQEFLLNKNKISEFEKSTGIEFPKLISPEPKLAGELGDCLRIYEHIGPYYRQKYLYKNCKNQKYRREILSWCPDPRQPAFDYYAIRLHDCLLKIFNLQKKSTKTIPIDKTKYKPTSDKKIFLQLLDSNQKLQAEGREMKHCLGTYTVQPDYAYYSVISGNRRLTVQFRKKDGKINQISGVNNSAVKWELRKKIESLILGGAKC